MIRRVALSVVAVAALGLTACSSDSTSKTATTTASRATVSGGAAIPDSVAGVSEGCLAFAKAMASAVSGGTASGGTDFSQVSESLSNLKNVVPDDLKDDAEVFANAYGKLFEMLATSGGDFTKVASDPSAQAAMAALSSADVQAASTALQSYFQSQCPQG